MSKLLPLRIGVKRVAWRAAGQFESERPEWSVLRKGILERDNHTCVFCGFYASAWQEVHHLNDDHDDNQPDNLVTACPLCHATQHIGLAGLYRRGRLIWLPEISQADLNSMMRWLELWPSFNEDVGSYMTAPRQNLYEFLEHRVKVCERKMGTSDPTQLGNQLLNSSDDEYEHEQLIHLAPVRLLPVIENYPEPVRQAWRIQLSALVPNPSMLASYLQAGAKGNAT